MLVSTPRLNLRPIRLSDKESLFAYRSDAEANKYQGAVPKSINDAGQFIKNTARTPNIAGTWFQLAIIEKESQEMIGDLGINFHKENYFRVSLGYTVAKQKQGKGFATEALRHVIDHVFREMGKNEILVHIDPENRASIRVAEKLGFTDTQNEIVTEMHGQSFTDRIYCLTKSDWLSV
ncbi:GNAT family N-acetyltransferase [uncultured Draconibacterium sp.]|uniref:GNAT family N-acetyltransferase n=1 Tax=uncultured Draconibacterium sp. TaxID=1573823 RepID=UPI0025D5DED1|nr:GNAT family N-acetyltransferase [uncultured Draconibacterium sp.]